MFTSKQTPVELIPRATINLHAHIVLVQPFARCRVRTDTNVAGLHIWLVACRDVVAYPHVHLSFGQLGTADAGGVERLVAALPSLGKEVLYFCLQACKVRDYWMRECAIKEPELVCLVGRLGVCTMYKKLYVLYMYVHGQRLGLVWVA